MAIREFCNTDVVNDIHNNINTTNGDVKEEYQLKGGPDISGIEKHADALEYFTERFGERKNGTSRRYDEANGIIGNERTGNSESDVAARKATRKKRKKSHFSGKRPVF